MKTRAVAITFALVATSFIAAPTAHASLGMQGYNCTDATYSMRCGFAQSTIFVVCCGPVVRALHVTQSPLR